MGGRAGDEAPEAVRRRQEVIGRRREIKVIPEGQSIRSDALQRF